MKIAKLILHYNTPKLTADLCRMVPDAIIIDNGSDKQPLATGNMVISLAKNYGFTIGWNLAIKMLWNDYDAFWLMNSDITITPESVNRVCKLIENEDIDILTPVYNCWMKHCQQQITKGLRSTNIIEFTAPVIKKSVFEKIGLFDERFAMGYGVEFDFCYRARQKDLKIWVDDGSSFHHIGHQTIKANDGIIAYSKKANFELTHGLLNKYGWDWMGIVLKDVDIKTDFDMNIAVYTTLFGDYDTHKQWPEQNIKAKYYIITDNPNLKVPGWETIVPNFPRHDLNARLRAKYFKMFPWEIPQLDAASITVYIDASIQVESEHFIDYCIRNLTADMLLYKHPQRTCIYDEAKASMDLLKYKTEPIKQQIESYKPFFPSKQGLYACGVMIRKHTDIVKKVMFDWWWENIKYSYQDQLSFPVVCKLNDFKPATFAENQYKNEYFKVKWHDDTIKLNPEITVLMPIYNTPVEYIKIAIDSILKQTFTTFELLIVDDNNSDQSIITCINDFELSDKRIRVISTNENKGIAAALNYGIENAACNLIVRMDADDIAEPTLLQKHFNWFAANPDKNICGVQIELFSPEKVWQSHHESIITKQKAINNKGFWVVNHPGIGYRTEFIKKFGSYGNSKQGQAEDYALWCKILASGEIIYNMPDVLIHYRVITNKKYNQDRKSPEWFEFLEQCKQQLYERYNSMA
jgi:GT2 family glycosyltransferase